MGMFDSVRLPSGRIAQVKCFGCGMTHVRIDDKVELVPRSRTGDDISWVPRPATFQVALDDGSFLTVVDGHLRACDQHRRGGLPVVDSYGFPWSGEASSAGRVLPEP